MRNERIAMKKRKKKKIKKAKREENELMINMK
jgi:hypothetical protein